MKVKRQFSIFNSHLDLAHHYWKEALREGDWALDATCGNGHDTLCLAQICEGVIGLDIQQKALDHTKALLTAQEIDLSRIYLFCQSHEQFPPLAYISPIQLVVYNLGYLPGEDKGLTTKVLTTLKSVQRALKLIPSGGMVSVTCYPGHPEGRREEKALLSYCTSLPSSEWSVSFHSWQNRYLSPSLLLIQKVK